MSMNVIADWVALDAVQQDGSYPRPQLVRRQWASLDGEWDFARDPSGITTKDEISFDHTIQVPFPPESPASGIGETGPCKTVWYRRTVTPDDVRRAGRGEATPRVLLHFGAVDFRATVWVDGQLLGTHIGGQTPFEFDITELLGAAGEDHVLAVRADDDPGDVEQPRGKQDWHSDPHSIWYHRTTGIWQPVWLEAVPETWIDSVALTPDITGAAVAVDVSTRGALIDAAQVSVEISLGGRDLGSASAAVQNGKTRIRVPIEALSNGQAVQEFLWSPERPQLLNVTIALSAGPVTDRVASYTGLRTVEARDRHFLLNGRPYFLRSVLEQGYWPASHLAAPSSEALREEVELIKRLGFNAARIHQKAEDPRFLFWADRLGLLIWAEAANAYQFSPRAVSLMVNEWTELVERDRSHPCIVTWVPLNESWGVQHISDDPRQQAFSRAIADLTRALDGTRPVISNDGWEHTHSDIWTIHDYTPHGSVLTARYGTTAAAIAMLESYEPGGHRVALDASLDCGQPFMLTEFGGISFDLVATHDAWGYSAANGADDFEARLTDVVTAAAGSGVLAGFCYTQLTDTGQETNGLLTAERTPKLPWDTLHAIITVGPR